MPTSDWRVVIGASAGGLEAVKRVCRDFSPQLPAAVFIVIHTSSETTGRLVRVLQRHVRLPIALAEDGDPIVPGRILLAPPDRHLTVDGDRVRLGSGPKEHGFRPAIDPLFRTAAASSGSAAIGVILSGALNDGTAGLAEIKRRGGLAFVQHPDEAELRSMPEKALEQVAVDGVLLVDQIGPAIVNATRDHPPGRPRRAHASVDRAIVGTPGLQHAARPGHLTNYTCPDCGGTLTERDENGTRWFECHVGHVFSGDSLVLEQNDALDQALWTALRTLEEAIDLRRKLGEDAARRQLLHSARAWQRQREDLEDRAETVRRALRLDVTSSTGEVVPDRRESPVLPTGAARQPRTGDESQTPPPDRGRAEVSATTSSADAGASATRGRPGRTARRRVRSA